jgi:alkanesulfonate monooxygenase SsuD/methylene tetrahydromethanopterin reductase-like flavin-dependent oxidoreductase (luciferase family)
LYGETAAQEGYQAGSENFGYLQQIFVAETEEKAQELGKAAMFGGGAANFSRPEWTLPPGYNSKEATRRLARQATEYGFLGITSEKLRESTDDRHQTRERLRRGEVSVEEARRKIYANYQKAQDGLQIIIGTPKSVIPRLRLIMEVLHPSIMGLFQAQGPLALDQRMTSIRLMGQEVLPAIREIAKELGIKDPFERAPGSRPHVAGAYRESLVDLDALKRAPKRDESVRV